MRDVSKDVGGTMPTQAILSGSSFGAAMPQWLRLGLLALGYFAAAQASLVFAIPPGYATAIWPPSGIALAALLLWGPRACPGVWLGALLTNYAVDLSMPAAFGIATGNTLEALCACWLMNRWTERNAEFRQPESVFLFAAIAALASVVAASFGVASLYAVDKVGAAELAGNWYTWWQGDFSGILLVTPCLLAWSRREAPLACTRSCWLRRCSRCSAPRRWNSTPRRWCFSPFRSSSGPPAASPSAR
jgi:integral membrane sensor domain MASE1